MDKPESRQEKCYKSKILLFYYNKVKLWECYFLRIKIALATNVINIMSHQFLIYI